MNTTFEGAVVTEQDKKFAVVSVQRSVFQDTYNAGVIIKAMIPIFKGIPVLLMTIDNQENPAYFGRPDLVLLAENVNIKEAKWEQITADIDLTNSCPMKDMED